MWHRGPTGAPIGWGPRRSQIPGARAGADSGARPTSVGCRRYLTPVQRAPCPGGLQALPDAGSARTLPRWAAGETPVRRAHPGVTSDSTSYSLQDCPLSERSSPKSFRHKRLSHARSGCRELSLGSRLRRDSTQLHNDPNGTMWRSRAMVLTWKGNRVGWFIDHALQLVGLRGLWSVRGPDLLLPGQGPVFWVVSGRSFM
jgi:hypothetical protein